MLRGKLVINDRSLKFMAKFESAVHLQDVIILENENNLINRLLKEAQLYINIAQEKIRMKKRRLQFGLTDERIQQFDIFEADDSFVGDRCDVCLEDVDLGR